MKQLLLAVASAALLAGAPAFAANPPPAKTDSDKAQAAAEKPGGIFQPESASSEGQVAVEGQSISYHAVAGTIVVHPKGWDDSIAKAVAA